MQSILNTLDTKGLLDYDNLNIITHPPPPRRRQSGASLIPFRPYVKCLTSVRQPFSFTNGIEKWVAMGRDEKFFTQPNARCIGSLMSDCHISDVIRWDIEGESTRLPMMCKLWMIVDGAIVERGKPHLVQDAAVQVHTAGRNRRAIMSAQHSNDQTTTTTTTKFDRRRRQSWHDLSEYHSVSYYQYTRPVRGEFQKGVQCDIDNEYSISKQEILSSIEEQVVNEDTMNDFRKENVRETVHHFSIPQEHVHVSITTQTESPFTDRSTSVDSQLIRMFNLNLETNEILLSSIVNPYLRALSSNDSSKVISFYRNGREYNHRSVSTGDDYPHWWLRLTTDLLLADFITNQGEEKETSLPPPSPRQDQSVQTDVEKSRISLGTMDETHDGNNVKRRLPFSDISQRMDSRLSDYQIDNSSIRSYGNHVKQPTSSKQSETDYNIFVTSLHHQQSSTPDSHSHRIEYHSTSNDTTRERTKSSESASTLVLANLLQRYERTLRERQRAFTIIDDALLDIDDVLKHYRIKIQNSSTEQSNTTMELYRDISLLSPRSKNDRSSTTSTSLIRDKYRTMPGITCDEMIQGYIPSPRIYLSNSTITLPRERQPRFEIQSKEIARPTYCNLYLTDYNPSSAWIRYNERRVEDLQRRIDLMLQIDDNEEADLLLSSPVYPTTSTVTQRIDDILMTRSKYPCPLIYHHDRILSPRRYQYRLPHRLHQSLPTTPRQLSRGGTRSTTPVSKSVRISTQSVPLSSTRARQTSSVSRPVASILRRTSVPYTPRSSKLIESSHVWQSKVDGNTYVLKQFSIPRYYRLYNDASFREMYDFSRLLNTYWQPDRTTRDYSSLLTNFALEQQLPSHLTSVA